MKFDTILFDMDGTLFDTERVYHEAWNEAGVPDEIYFRFIGQGKKIIDSIIEKETDLDPAKARKEKERITAEILKDNIPLKPCLMNTLEWLKQNGFHCCIATSSSEEVAERYLKKTDTAKYFEKVVSGHDLKNCKPAPDIYFLAAEAMNADPSQCVVVEDSFNGVRSGANAGMKTVMIPDEVLPDAEIMGKASIILHRLDELPVYLQMINGTLPE